MKVVPLMLFSANGVYAQLKMSAAIGNSALQDKLISILIIVLLTLVFNPFLSQWENDEFQSSGMDCGASQVAEKLSLFPRICAN